MKMKFSLPALALLVLTQMASADYFLNSPHPPNSNSDRPGADMQAYIGATMWDPAYAMNMNAESNPPPLPPGERGPKVTEQEQVDVNPQNEPRGPGTPNVSVAKKSTPTSTAEEPKIPLEY